MSNWHEHVESHLFDDDELDNIYHVHIEWNEEQDCYKAVRKLLAQIKWWEEWHDYLINK